MKLINFLPKIYTDELFYSVMGRYQKYSGYLNSKHTIIDFFGELKVTPTIEFQSNLISLENNLCINKVIKPITIIKNNSLLPAYFCFMKKEIVNEVIDLLINDNGEGIKYKIGLIPGGLCRKNYVYYCPICCQNEIKEYGEAYIHRNHQLQGVDVCEKHSCLLKPYKIETTKYEYVYLKSENLDFKVIYPKKSMQSKLNRISQDSYFLLNNEYGDYYIDDINNKYKFLLYQKGLANINGRINQKELYKKFIKYHGKEFLSNLECNVDGKNEFNWLKSIVRKPRKTIHPLRHILFMEFLCGDVISFIKRLNEENFPNLKGPWPCLNPSCKNYKELVINNCMITIDSKSKKEIGTFKCECGFIYSRPITKDLEYIGRVKCYGEVWENRLKELIKSQISIREIGRLMKCDSKTVIKYAEKLGLKHLLKTNRKGINPSKRIFDNRLKYSYRNEVLKTISLQPGINRSQLRSLLSKEYIYLYKNDKAWFEKNMPTVKKNTCNTRDYTNYWKKKDNEILQLVKNAYGEIILINRESRITKSAIGRKIKRSALIEKKLDKIPNTKEYLEKICESVEDYRYKRLDKTFKIIRDMNLHIANWKIIRMAGIRYEDRNILDRYNSIKTN